MTEYILLTLGLGAMYLLSPKFTQDDQKRTRFVYICFFVGFFLLLALRHPSMGIDLQYGKYDGYLAGFREIHDLSWEQIFSNVPFRNYEKGFVVFCKLIGNIFLNEQFFLAACAAAALIPLSIAIWLSSEDKLMSAAIFLGLPIFCLLFSTLRQIIAIGICALGIVCIQRKKPLPFLFAVLLAATFHKTALVFLLAYPLYHLRLTKAVRVISVILLPACYVLRENLMVLLSRLLGLHVVLDNNGSFMLFLLFSLIYVIGFWMSDDQKSEQNGFLNIFFLACLVQAFSGIYNIATRMGYYFTLALIFFLPSLVGNAKESNERTAARWTVIIAFVTIGLYFIYVTTWSISYPYYFFWETVPGLAK